MVRIRPPIRSRASSTSTLCPASESRMAAANPATPAPMTTTSNPSFSTPLLTRSPHLYGTLDVRTNGRDSRIIRPHRFQLSQFPPVPDRAFSHHHSLRDAIGRSRLADLRHH